MMSSYAIYLVLFLSWLWFVSGAICPKKCTCYLDGKGRSSVSCAQGGLTGSIPLTNIRLDTEVINITAPEDNMNTLTMAPVFDSFKDLEELHITRSNIPELGRYFFHSLKKLDVLNLSQNNITQPLDHNFIGLNNLKKLILDDNRIESLTSETFKHLQKLTLLSIRRNRIQNMMPRIFYHLSKLRVLKLSGNNLKFLNPVVFKDIPELHELECRGCALQTINEEVFQYLQHLVLLDLGYNEIERIFTNDFKYLKNLKKLKLDGNKILTIYNHDLIHLGELRKLNLAHNVISKIEPDAFSKVSQLKLLDISYNRLEEINVTVFRYLGKHLETLILSGNSMSIFFVQALSRSMCLNELHLADMGIIDLPPEILPSNLTILNLSGNNLYYLKPEALPPKLDNLDISHNHFRGLDEEVLQRIECVSLLNLDHNPWFCDLCHIVPLLERMNKSEAIRNLECFRPSSCEGRTLGSISKNELGWCSAPSYPSPQDGFESIFQDERIGIIAAGTSVVLLALIATAIVVALCYSRRHAAKYYTHEEKRADESEAIFDNQMSFLGDEKEISFKFPVDYGEKKMTIATIGDEIKKEKTISNGV